MSPSTLALRLNLMNDEPYFPKVWEYANMVSNLGWDTAHLHMVKTYGAAATNALDIRLRTYNQGN